MSLDNICKNYDDNKDFIINAASQFVEECSGPPKIEMNPILYLVVATVVLIGFFGWIGYRSWKSDKESKNSEIIKLNRKNRKFNQNIKIINSNIGEKNSEIKEKNAKIENDNDKIKEKLKQKETMSNSNSDTNEPTDSEEKLTIEQLIPLIPNVRNKRIRPLYKINIWTYLMGENLTTSKFMVGMASGLVFGFIDNAGLFFGMDALDPLFASMISDKYGEDKDNIKAGMGNTYSDMVGSFLSVFIGRIISIYSGIDQTPMVADSIGLIIGCILGFVLPVMMKSRKPVYKYGPQNSYNNLINVVVLVELAE